DLQGRTVLDIGCGSGPYIAEALCRGASGVVGIDPAPRMIDLARHRVANLGLQDKVTLLEGYFPEVWPEEKQDYAIVMGVLDYIPDSEPMVRSILESVNRGAVISFPSRHWLRTPIRRARYNLRKCPVWFYDRSDVERIARFSGA